MVRVWVADKTTCDPLVTEIVIHYTEAVTQYDRVMRSSDVVMQLRFDVRDFHVFFAFSCLNFKSIDLESLTTTLVYIFLVIIIILSSIMVFIIRILLLLNILDLHLLFVVSVNYLVVLHVTVRYKMV